MKEYPIKVTDLASGLANDGRTKKERYAWSDFNENFKPKPMHLNLEDLNVDTYQRGEVSKKSSLGKAKDFSFEAAGALIVGQRQDKSFWIVDGLQRALALLRRGDTKKTYCMVFQSRGYSHEASVFYLCNIGRVGVKAIHKYNVAVASNFSPQVEIAEWLFENNFNVADDDTKNTLRFIGVFQSTWQANPENTKRALLFTRELGNGHLDSYVFKGAVFLLNRNIDIEQYIGKIQSIGGLTRIKNKINEIAIIASAPKKYSICGRGLLDVINYRLKAANRINIF